MVLFPVTVNKDGRSRLRSVYGVKHDSMTLPCDLPCVSSLAADATSKA